MARQARSRLIQIRNQILEIADQHTDLNVLVKSLGNQIVVNIREPDGAAAPRPAPIAARRPRALSRPVPAGVTLPSADEVLELIKKTPGGLPLGELAAAFDLQPRTLLKPILEDLVTLKQVERVTNRYRVPGSTRRGRAARKGLRKGARRRAAGKKPGRKPGRKPAAAATATESAPARKSARKRAGKKAARKTARRGRPARKSAARKSAAKKSTAKKAAARKSAVKKSAAKKSAVKKSAAKKSAAKKSAGRKAAAKTPAVSGSKPGRRRRPTAKQVAEARKAAKARESGGTGSAAPASSGDSSA